VRGRRYGAGVKVALVCDRVDPAGGGLEQWISALAPRLEQRGHDVHIIAFHVAGGGPRERTHVVPARAGRLDRAAAVEREVALLAPDVTHDTGVGWSYDVLQPQAGSKLANHRRDLASLATGARLRARWSPERYRWRRDVYELEQRQYQRATGLVLAVSRLVARDLQSLWSVADERLRIVPNGVDTERFSPARCAVMRGAARAQIGVDESTALFLFAARNPTLKGLLPLLRATAVLREHHTRVRVVAIGSEPGADFRRAAARLRVDDIVTFAGVVDDPVRYYAAADVFVLPTYYDACSLTVLEALACGLPVITSRYNGAAELLAHDRDGFVLDDPDDVRSLAALMDRASADGVRRRISLAARTLALRHTLDRNVEAVEHAYAEALARRVRFADARRISYQVVPGC
jgi:UDP-glucose:(heptosyl)LPS alpha-1,3-glucosyltransferase